MKMKILMGVCLFFIAITLFADTRTSWNRGIGVNLDVLEVGDLTVNTITINDWMLIGETLFMHTGYDGWTMWDITGSDGMIIGVLGKGLPNWVTIDTLGNFQGNGTAEFMEEVTFYDDVIFDAYTRHVAVQANAAILGPNAPTPTTVGTFRGLGFDADNEAAYFVFTVPTDWDGASDMFIHVHWYPTAGDAVANGETVKWDATYRSIVLGEAVDNGTAVIATATLTGGASETDKELYSTDIIIDYDNGNQPLTIGDLVGFQFDRDVTTDDYSGAGIVVEWHVEYTSNALPEN